MKSFKFGEIKGISLELHSTFVLLMGFVVAVLALFYPAQLIPTVVLLFLLFLSVFIHELVHSMVAISKGVKVKKITLLPIGGIAMTEDMPSKPWDEFLISVAGPLFNFAVVLLIALAITVFPWLPMPPLESLSTAEGLNNAVLNYPLFGLLWVNLILGAFNLFLPALPLDGGRVMRSLLAMVFGASKATAFVAKISLVIAIALIIIGVITVNIIIAVIALFIYFGSSYENETTALVETIKGESLSEIVSRSFTIVDCEMPAAECLEEMKRQNQTHFLVKGETSLGLITVEAFERLKEKEIAGLKVKSLAEPMPIVSLAEGNEKIVRKFLSSNLPLLGVVEGTMFKGVLEREGLNRLYRIARIRKRKG